MPPIAAERIQAILAKTLRPEGDAGCWIFTGRKNWKGYAEVKVSQRHKKAHRVVYEHFNGPIPGGLVCDHLCRNRACINPAHIEAVTVGENNRRGAGYGGVLSPRSRAVRPAAAVTKASVPLVCRHGHPYDEANTKVTRDKGRPKRRCLTCYRAKKAAEKRKARAVKAQARTGTEA